MKVEQFPLKDASQYDVICNAPAVFGSLFLRDTIFHNFKNTYPSHSSCSNNAVFRNHKTAASASLGHYLTNVQCLSCDVDARASLENPKAQWFSWFGGCGDVINCSGLKNLIIQDLSGEFYGYPSTIISYNNSIGASIANCTPSVSENIYVCERADLGVVEWDARSPDRHLLSSAPVYIVNDEVNILLSNFQEGFNNTINIWREWSWNGPEPMNQRANSYVSLVILNRIYNVTYASTKVKNIL